MEFDVGVVWVALTTEMAAAVQAIRMPAVAAETAIIDARVMPASRVLVCSPQ